MKLCGVKLCDVKLCDVCIVCMCCVVCEEEGEARKRGGGGEVRCEVRRCQPKNKNPTRQCGEKFESKKKINLQKLDCKIMAVCKETPSSARLKPLLTRPGFGNWQGFWTTSFRNQISAELLKSLKVDN